MLVANGMSVVMLVRSSTSFWIRTIEGCEKICIVGRYGGTYEPVQSTRTFWRLVMVSAFFGYVKGCEKICRV